MLRFISSFFYAGQGEKTAFPFSAYPLKAARPVSPFTCLPEPSQMQTKPLAVKPIFK